MKGKVISLGVFAAIIGAACTVLYVTGSFDGPYQNEWNETLACAEKYLDVPDELYGDYRDHVKIVQDTAGELWVWVMARWEGRGVHPDSVVTLRFQPGFEAVPRLVMHEMLHEVFFESTGTMGGHGTEVFNDCGEVTQGKKTLHRRIRSHEPRE